MNENLKVGMVFKNVNPVFKKWNEEKPLYALIEEIDKVIRIKCWFKNSPSIYHCDVIEWNPKCWEQIDKNTLDIPFRI